MNGQIRRGRYLSFGTRLSLSRGLALMKDGSVVFAGSSKRVNEHNF
jgi:hypothetical protein